MPVISGGRVIEGSETPIFQQPAVADLTNVNGVGDGTIADVGAAFSQATLNNNFRDLSDKVNAILAALRAAGVIA